MNAAGAGSLGVLCGRYGIDGLYVFGSRAREIAQRLTSAMRPVVPNASDVDVGVLPRQGVVFDVRRKAQLMADLEDLLEVAHVDVVVLPEAPPFLAVEIVRGELLYTADPDRTGEYELYVLRRAGDLAPFEHERIEQILTGGAA